MGKVTIKRVYEPLARGEGKRVLVDRIWPRGISKEELKDVLWLKEVAPSTELRQWFGHKPERWAEFRIRYRAELKKNPEAVAKLRALAKRGHVTLLYAAKDEEHNQAVVLGELLEGGGDAK
jgi:uncharacterized protein YeaO (DUF488 family)